MAILSVIEYKEEGLAILEDENGKFVITDVSPEFISLTSVGQERDYFFIRRGYEEQQSWSRMLT